MLCILQDAVLTSAIVLLKRCNSCREIHFVILLELFTFCGPCMLMIVKLGKKNDTILSQNFVARFNCVLG